MRDELYRDLVALTAKDGLQSYKYRPKFCDDSIRNDLTTARQAGRLVLVLGAGVSLPSGLDSWQALVENAAKKLFANTAIPDMPTILKASGKSSMAQIRFCESSAELKTGFRVFLVEALYEKYEPTAVNLTLEALCNLILGLDGRERIADIITYNFDNLLERALEKKVRKLGLDLSIVPIVSDETYKRAKQSNSIRIFHPHGYLPYGVEFGAVAKLPIVFSETDYHKNFQDTSYWANTVQLDMFERNTCLFVGLSFACANMRRLLDFVQLKGPPAFEHAALIRIGSRYPRNLENYIINMDLNSFGVRPVWIADYGDIPTFIARI
jgi:NAD-dependent SIR2 family protein deacetylase